MSEDTVQAKEADVTLSAEAERITEYLLSTHVQEPEKRRYVDAIRTLEIELSGHDQALWENMMRSPWRMACIDAGLALVDPLSPVRRRLFTMLAILEVSPRYTEFFLSREYRRSYVFKLGAVGVRAAFRAMVGWVLVKKIHREWH